MADPRVTMANGNDEALAENATADVVGEPLTKEAVADLIAAAMNKVNNDLSAKIGRLAKTAPKGEDEQEPTSGKNGQQIERTLRDRLAALEQKENAAKTRAVRMTLKEKLVANGADPVLAEMATAAILESEGDRFAADEDKYGQYAVKYGDSTIDDWAKGWMSTESGKRIASGSSAPNLNLGGKNKTAPRMVKQVPIGLAHTVSDEELKSGRVEITY